MNVIRLVSLNLKDLDTASKSPSSGVRVGFRSNSRVGVGVRIRVGARIRVVKFTQRGCPPSVNYNER